MINRDRRTLRDGKKVVLISLSMFSFPRPLHLLHRMGSFLTKTADDKLAILNFCSFQKS